MKNPVGSTSFVGAASGGNSPGTLYEEFPITVDTTTFTITLFTPVSGKVKILVGGILYPKATIVSVVGQVVTVTPAIPAYSLVTISN